MSVLMLVVAIGAPLCGVASLALILSFLRHVYDRGGADDLLKAARALREARRSHRKSTRPTRPPKLTRRDEAPPREIG